MGKEIERKFKIKEIPNDIVIIGRKNIAQGYLAITGDGSELRIRRMNELAFLTYKKGKGKVRDEFEMDISFDLFEILWPKTQGKRIFKERIRTPLGDNIIEIDIFKEREDNLIIAEVEFLSEELSNNFVKPIWFGEEVTEDPAYKNQNLAK
jgi:adenylate cyclase